MIWVYVKQVETRSTATLSRAHLALEILRGGAMASLNILGDTKFPNALFPQQSVPTSADWHAVGPTSKKSRAIGFRPG
jgi:hypothetical protein